jgi:4-diphosphocytidyl-2-C-methyl-D-erythritol kinase
VSGRAARVVAQAKVNLFLEVLAREESGFHQLETAFCRLELGDEVRVRVSDRGRSLDCSGADVGPAEENLAFRAAELYARAAAWPRGYAIEIDKRVPVGGGLGGGSADAAAVLRALNALNPAPVAPAELLALAGSLGADVPYLASPAALALAWGRGDRMIALPALPARDVALAVPSFGVPTRDAYGWLADWRARHGGPPSPRQLSADELSSWRGVAALGDNAFAAPVFQRHPELHAIVADFERRADRALLVRMTGSGSTIFAVYEAMPALAAVEQRLAAGGGRLLRTRTAARVAEVEVTE